MKRKVALAAATLISMTTMVAVSTHRPVSSCGCSFSTFASTCVSSSLLPTKAGMSQNSIGTATIASTTPATSLAALTEGKAVVYITAPTKAVAQDISRRLISLSSSLAPSTSTGNGDNSAAAVNETDAFTTSCTNPTADITVRLLNSEVHSVYEWNGSIEESTESLLMICTPVDMLPTLIAAVRELHPYDCPEIIAVNAEHFVKRVEMQKKKQIGAWKDKIADIEEMMIEKEEL